MKRRTIFSLILSASAFSLAAQDAPRTSLTKEEAKNMFGTYTMKRISVHDPSITWDPNSQTYYIFGSHRAQASTKDLMNWTEIQAPWGMVRSNGSIASGVANNQAFSTQAVKTVTIGGKTVDMQNFDALAWSAAYGEGYSVDGNMWAPDIIYNPVMKKWCMYLSINGPHWNSSVILLTADKIDGTYTYQAPIVISGFNSAASTTVPFDKTDMQLALGSLSALPGRYDKGNSWGSFWPHCIDPCVFYDEEGTLWLSYGSWSGGIWMLKLDKNTGLRDYDTEYGSDYAAKGQAVTTDPYFGKKIAGGCYVSGEASYIEHIGNYYYLFVTNGGLEADGGYEMRVFRSENPDGPYTDTKGTSAIYSSYALNYGLNSDTRGMKVLGSYGKWGNMSIGETAQGHNSVLAAEDGRTYLVYHTRFHDGGPGHQVRVHQLFLNQDGWLVAAPFEYTGEQTTDQDIAANQMFYNEDVTGTYLILIHKYKMDHKNLEEVEPDTIQLNANGTVSGKYKGSWKIQEGTSYINIAVNGQTYKGVLTDQMMENTKTHATCFTAVGYQGAPLWGYKISDKYQLATALNAYKAPVFNRKNIYQNIDLYDTELPEKVTLEWKSSAPDILSDYGRYNPEGLEADSTVTLTATLSCGRYYWSDTYNVKVKADNQATGDFATGLKAYYDFDDSPILNRYNSEQTAELKKELITKKATLESDNERNGCYLQQNYGKYGRACYTEFINPLKGLTLENGVTLSMWVKRGSDDKTGTLFSFYDAGTKATLYAEANAHFAFNNQENTQLDINHPDTVAEELIPAGKWALLTVTIDTQNGLTYYVDGARKYTERYKGMQDGSEIKKKAEFDFARILQHIAACDKFYFGLGGDNGSAAAGFDDLMIYDRALSATDVKGLCKMANSTHNFSPTAINGITADKNPTHTYEGVYNLNGQKLKAAAKGFQIVNGKKVYIK